MDDGDDAVCGTFLVTHADPEHAVLRNVETAQVHTLADTPDVAVDDVLEATLESGPMGVTWSIAAIHDRRTVRIERLDDPPAEHAVAAVADGDLGGGVTLEPDDALLVDAMAVTEDADAPLAELATDDATRSRAARLGATRVELRAGDGVVTVRYRD
jgi:hypothetical protein